MVEKILPQAGIELRPLEQYPLSHHFLKIGESKSEKCIIMLAGVLHASLY